MLRCLENLFRFTFDDFVWFFFFVRRSVPEEGKRRVCKEAVLPEVVRLLQEADVKVQANAVAVIMYTAITTEGTRAESKIKIHPAGRIVSPGGPVLAREPYVEHC